MKPPSSPGRKTKTVSEISMISVISVVIVSQHLVKLRHQER